MALNSRSNHSFNLTLASSLQKNPETNKYTIRAKRDAEGGIATVRTFIDDNGNGEFDRGEKPAPGIIVKSAGKTGKATNMHGRTTLYNLPLHRPVRLKLEPDETTDPFLFGLDAKKQVILNDGNVARVNYALLPTGEILGTVYKKHIDKDGTVRLVRLANVLVEVVARTGHQKGKVIASTRTTFDGSYIFASVPIGKSELRIAPAYLKHAHLRIIPHESVTNINLNQPGDYVEDADLIMDAKMPDKIASNMP